MRRTIMSVLVCVALLFLVRGWNAAPLAADAKDTKKVEPSRNEDGPAGFLSKRVDFNGFDDVKLTLSEALSHLEKLYGVSFGVNDRAFKSEQVNDVGATAITETRPIPGMKNARLDRVLRQVLARIPVASGATFLMRRDTIEITTNALARAEVWGEGFDGPFLPLVNARLQKVPLDEALNQLADQSQFNIIVDKRASEKATTPVSGRFHNLPLDTAVRLLVEMAELKAVQRDNALFVTTSENANKLEKQFDRDKPRAPEPMSPATPMASPFGGLGGFCPVVPHAWRKGPGHADGAKTPNDSGM
jgi:hypothetical protein